MSEIFYVKGLNLQHQESTVVKELSFTVKKGCILSVMGPNGAGKTTLLNTLAGLSSQEQTWGWRYEDGRDHRPCPKKRLAYLPQQVYQDKTFPISVKEVVAMARKDSPDAVETALAAVGLASYGSKPIESLSLGKFQCMLFARLILQNADFILLDEPFASIDEPTVQQLLAVIFSWTDAGKTILLSHHHRERALRYFPETLLLGKHGYQWGPSQTVLQEPFWTQAHAPFHGSTCG